MNTSPRRLSLRSARPQSFLLLASLFLPIAAWAQTVLVPTGSTWKYLDNGSNQGTAWRAVDFADSGWKSGAAELGYGDGGEVTRIEDNATAGYVSTDTNRYITTYFRKSFSVADPAAFTSLKVRLMRDDGAVIYLNGVEVRRDNLPTGAIGSNTPASVAIGGADESTFFETTIAPDALVDGTNVLAVEVHQQSATSTDVSFDLELLGGTGAPGVTRGPYLQKATPASLVIRWRTDAATDSTVRYGTDPAGLNLAASDAAVTTEHEVELSNLTPDTRYYYSVGTSTATLAGGSEFAFFTPPPVGTAQPTRIWVLGDSGTANANAAAVRDAYINYTGTVNTDVWMMLGDNAYNSGTDAEFQAAVFNMYPSILRETALWSTLGNHEYLTASAGPYFQIHTFPTQGEAGGAPSGTEKYYSFDHANIHFICLDSMSSDRSATGPMATWLRNDLEATVQQWIVAFWHHPPYTKGSHDSDNSNGADPELVQMRQSFLPILEAGGVDLVLGGHSHSYERSYLVNGHYGLSSTFSPSMKIDGGDGREGSGGVYEKPAGLPANQGAVYAVAGSSGKATNWWGGSTAATNPNPHPVMFASLLQLGSLVIDVSASRMDVKFLRSTGTVADSFSIVKTTNNVPPTVSISSPAEGAAFDAPDAITVTAEASDTDGTVAQVDFYAGNTLIGTDSISPFSVTWDRPPTGQHPLTAAATDDGGATVTSSSVNITVTQPLPPDAPTGVTATPGSDEVTLSWTTTAGATSYQVKRATTTGGPYATIAAAVAGTSFTDTSASNGTRWFYVISAMNSSGESGNSAEVSALNNGAPTVSISSPAQGATFPGGTNISITATATDDGGVARVDFYAGETLLGSDTSSPYGITWSSVPAGEHALTAIAVDSFDATALSTVVSISVTEPPSAPTGLGATAGDAQVSLSWTSSPGATSYDVKRATTGGGPYQEVAIGITETAFTDPSLTNGTTYFYVVSAVSSAGESENSSEVSATPLPPAPGAPASVSAVAGNAQVTVSWTVVGGASSYNVKRSTVSGGPYQTVGSGVTGTSFTDTLVTNGTTYFYVVSAVNLGGESPDSTPASATPTAPPVAPAAPSNLTAAAASRSQVNLSWADGSSNEQGFKIERSTNGRSFTQIATVGAGVTSYSSTGLSANRPYYYRVRAYNTVGNSPYSNTATAKTLK